MCPGDALHVPSFWWHGVYSAVSARNLSLSMSFFYPRPDRRDHAGDVDQVTCAFCSSPLRGSHHWDDMQTLEATVAAVREREGRLKDVLKVEL